MSVVVKKAVLLDRAAFTTLYDYYLGRVYKHVYYRVRNRNDAEDLVQDVFIRAWKAIGRYQDKGVPFIGWLMVIADNLISDYHSSRSNFNQTPLDEISDSVCDTSPGPDDLAEIGFRNTKVREAILSLSSDKQRVIVWRFIDGFSHREIAKILRKSEGAVRVLQYRALTELKQSLEPD
jgi:RNA polymerase sigma-70 factor (ECF subfamily)